MYGEESGLIGNGEKANRMKCILAVVVVAFIIWNIILFILAVVALAKADSDSVGYTYEPVMRAFTVDKDHSLKADDVVSFLPNGRLRPGAGTTLFANVGPGVPSIIPAGLDSIRMDSLISKFEGSSLSSTETVVVCYTETATKSAGCLLGTISLNQFTIKQWASKVFALPVPGFVESVVGLGPSQFIVAVKGKLYLGILSIPDSSSASISYTAAVDIEGEINVELTALSNARVAVGYRKTAVINGLCTIGTRVVGVLSNSSLVAGPEVTFTAGGSFHTLFALSSNTYIVSYPNKTASDTIVLEAFLFRVDSQRILLEGPVAQLTDVSPNFYLASASLQKDVGVVVLVDQLSSNTLKAVAVSRNTNTGGLISLDSVVFGSIISLTGESVVTTSTYTSSLDDLPYISACSIDDTRFGVAFSFHANGGRLTTVVGEIDPANLRLRHATPVISYSDGLANTGAASFWWVAVAPLEYNGRVGFAILDSLQVNSTNAYYKRSFALVDVGPAPFGVARGDASGLSSVSLALDGVTELKRTKLIPGHSYFSDAHGDLIDGGYVLAASEYIQSNNTFVTRNSFIGVAVSNTELLIRL